MSFVDWFVHVSWKKKRVKQTLKLIYLFKINLFQIAFFLNFLKTDFSYLDIDYDLDFKSEEELNKFRVWGLPLIQPHDPLPLAIWGGLALGAVINLYRRRPALSSSPNKYKPKKKAINAFLNLTRSIHHHHQGLQVHAASGLFLGLTAKLTYAVMDDWRKNREMVIWDYVKKHPQDFPEVFNRTFASSSHHY